MEVKDPNNHVRTVHIRDVKKTTMPEVILNAVCDYSWVGRAAKLEAVQEVSLVSTTLPKMKREQTQTGMCTQAQTPNKSWFWKVIDVFKAGLSCQINSANSSGPYLYKNPLLKLQQ